MALIIDADGKYYTGTGTIIASAPTEFSVIGWFEAIDYTQNSIIASFGPGTADSVNAMSFGRSPHWIPYGVVNPSNNEFDLSSNQVLAQENTTWHVVIITFKQNVAYKTYVDGGLRQNSNAQPPAPLSALWSTFNTVRLGQKTHVTTATTRQRIAHVALWEKELTANQALDLYDGSYSGAAGNGFNPTQIENASLRFYQPLVSGIDDTGSVGTISWTPTGSPSFDSDNPTVNDPVGGGGGGNPATVMGRRIYILP